MCPHFSILKVVLGLTVELEKKKNSLEKIGKKIKCKCISYLWFSAYV